jgi:predicted dienelactone hydrolase
MTPAGHPLTRRALALAGASAAALLPLRALRAAGVAAAQELSWLDPSRQRTLPLLMRWPAGEAPCALVLHSHGLGGSRHGGAAWGQAWQAAGFAVLHLQHPGSDVEVLRGGERGLRAAASAEQLIARAADVRFVIDEVERRQRDAASAPWGRLRVDAIGVSGHSFGAATTLATAGQRYPLGRELADPRPRAFIAFSPGPGRSRQPLAQQFGSIVRPMLLMTGSLDGDPLDAGRDPARTTGDYRASVYEGLPAGARALLWLDGADHMSFGGGRPGEGDRDARFFARMLRTPTERPAAAREPVHHALIQRTSLLWWRAFLLGDAEAATALRSDGVRAALAAGDRWTID